MPCGRGDPAGIAGMWRPLADGVARVAPFAALNEAITACALERKFCWLMPFILLLML